MIEKVFLKLGGSLITDKDEPLTAIIPQIDSIARQIKRYHEENPHIQLLIGHGSGSFGHFAASKYGTRNGVKTPEQWQGFTEVWAAARQLNQIVVERFKNAGLPVLSFPFSASAVTENKAVRSWNSAPIENALRDGLVALIYGDVVLDEEIGGTIFSTEEQFAALVPHLHPQRILLAGLEEGVWQDFPTCGQLISSITPSSFEGLRLSLQPSASVDVTGGMSSKVEEMLKLINLDPNLQIRIFSGRGDDTILRALQGEPLGTLLHRDV